MNTNQIRKLFLDYFIDKKHHKLSSGPIIPKGDKTLLFTNAGMVPLKDKFLGREQSDYDSATSAQLCIRAGGKHNDLENVGYTLRHHTLFEMLGNFSFGSYFKREAISYAWEFLTKSLQIPIARLWVTVYKNDDEAFAIWEQEIGVPRDRIIRCGDADNFWSMGDTGPCGPCSEIFYDHGDKVSGGPPGSPEAEGDRYVEIWNLVFMQYNRKIDGTLEPLEVGCVDTGMGLERIAAVMQGVSDNYDTDTFQFLLQSLSKLINQKDLGLAAMRVIVDHIRSAAFIIAHGVTPGNEGRSYVLRHIIRRALRYGFKLGEKQPFFYKMVAPLVEVMGDAYPELLQNQQHIEQVLKREENLFSHTLSHGLKLLEAEIAKLEGNIIPGQVVFKLYDTYGFPCDLTADIAKENNLSINMREFNEHLQLQRKQSQQSAQFHGDYTQQLHINSVTDFIGYKELSSPAIVKQIVYGNNPVHEIPQGKKGVIVLDKTPFYAEGGGQVGDSGLIKLKDNVFKVLETTKVNKTYLHHGVMQQGQLNTGDEVFAEVDTNRQAIACNHTATHLLHAALRIILGKHVQQKGSLVDSEKLRFDFTHSSSITPEQIDSIEDLVNQQIRKNIALQTSLQSLDEAKEAGAMALFDEKYEQQIRVLKIGEFSHEICGGTHVVSSGEIGLFKIMHEGAVASGIRRIEAVTAAEALKAVQNDNHLLTDLVQTLKTEPSSLLQRVSQLQQQISELGSEQQELKKLLVTFQSKQFLSGGKNINGVFALVTLIDKIDKEGLLLLTDQIKSQYPEHAVLLATIGADSKISLVATVSKNTSKLLAAGELLNNAAIQVGGRGGGRPTLAQGGGIIPEKLPEALKQTDLWLQQKLD